MDKEIYEMHAEICKTLANPKRLEIIDALRDGEKNVSELASTAKINQANISQHLTILRQKNIVSTRRDGSHIYYKLAYPEMIKACEIIRDVLQKQLAGNTRLSKRVR